MIGASDIDYLAALARLDLLAAEKISLAKELGAVLDYVAELKRTPVEPPDRSLSFHGDVKNISRPDTLPSTPVGDTDVLISAAPRTRSGYIVVKKILG